MPTPFTHLAAARGILDDPALPGSVRADLGADLSAFMLGSIAADGYYLASVLLKREDTHFYAYDHPIDDHPWRIMLKRFPIMRDAAGAARAFVAGYVGHLAMDQVWWQHMTRPHFGEREWAARVQRFFMLNVLLLKMDARDEHAARREAGALAAAQPDGWSAFMDDKTLLAWRDLIAQQLLPDGASQSVAIIAPRIGKTEAELHAVLEDDAMLESDLWAHIPRDLLASVEVAMADHMRASILAYWHGE